MFSCKSGICPGRWTTPCRSGGASASSGSQGKALPGPGWAGGSGDGGPGCPDGGRRRSRRCCGDDAGFRRDGGAGADLHRQGGGGQGAPVGVHDRRCGGAGGDRQLPGLYHVHRGPQLPAWAGAERRDDPPYPAGDRPLWRTGPYRPHPCQDTGAVGGSQGPAGKSFWPAGSGKSRGRQTVPTGGRAEGEVRPPRGAGCAAEHWRSPQPRGAGHCQEPPPLCVG